MRDIALAKQSLQEQLVVQSCVALFAREPGGPNSGLAVQAGNDQTGVICNRRKSCMRTCVPRLDQGVFNKRDSRFICGFDAPTGLRDQVEGEMLEQFSQLAELVLIVARKNDLLGCAQFRARGLSRSNVGLLLLRSAVNIRVDLLFKLETLLAVRKFYRYVELEILPVRVLEAGKRVDGFGFLDDLELELR